ncbi:MAG: purine-nucleoside phosphorylase [Tissierellia bacterium]|nr:purine-nucleoside phosphorylase [Tissierellia bacterium]
MTTAHNTANKGQIAETILLPGDPLRAKYIAENYLDDVKQFNSIRNMFGYTGTYKGKEVSVMGTGMGLPSMAIYSYELIHFFGVKNLIRIGSCGSYDADVKIHDIILCQGSCTDSNYAYQYDLPGTYSAIASFNLLEKAKKVADEKGYPVHVGNILSSDVFYDNNPDMWKKWAEMGVLGVEMESYALYCNAAKAGVNALTILTVSDSLVSNEQISAEDRENTFTKMMEIALELA